MGAVSPAARPKPRITPVRMPGSAWGSTWWRIVCQREAPRLRLTVRNCCGTARIASSVVLMTTGSVMMPKVSDPARIDVPKPINSTNAPRPKSP